MLYRPKFCCDCGEKIERSDWRIWTSRRFCPFCETEYKGHDLAIRGIVAGGVVLGVFGFSSYLGLTNQSSKQVSAPRTMVPDVRKPPIAKKDIPSGPLIRKDEPEMPTPAELSGSLTEPERSDVRKVSEQPLTQRTSSEKVSFFCGVTTRKGTPCSRKVKIKGARCWQHEGID